MTSSTSSRQVNSLLHNLRGEDFRRLQNQRGSRSHVIAYSKSSSASLPPMELESANTDDTALFESPPPSNTHKIVSGPPPPASWLKWEAAQRNQILPDNAEWRSHALSPFYEYLDDMQDEDGVDADGKVQEPNRIPSLRELCIRLLLEDGLQLELIPYIPTPLRKLMCRYAAVHAPFTSEELLLIYDPADAGASGEVIISGMGAKLSVVLPRLVSSSSEAKGEECDSWDTEADQFTPDCLLLRRLALLSTSLPPFCIPQLPATLTHLALLHLSPCPLPPVWRLGAFLPLLEFIDLSFNPWLIPTKAIDKVSWMRWGRLWYVGLRDCGFETERSRDLARKQISTTRRRRVRVAFN